MSNIRFMGPFMVPNDEPKSVNIDKISTALHVYYLNFIVNYLNTEQIPQIQAYNFKCNPCSDAISDPMNRVSNIKSGHDFCRYRNSIPVIYFQINEISPDFCRFYGGGIRHKEDIMHSFLPPPPPPLSVIVQIWSPPPPLGIQHALKMYAILDLSLL